MASLERQLSSRDHTVSQPQAQVFVVMKNRRFNREWNGRKEKQRGRDKAILLTFLIAVFGLGVTQDQQELPDNQEYLLTLSLTQLIVIGIWIGVATLVTEIFGKTKFIDFLYWTFVYVPMIFLVISIVFEGFLEMARIVGFFLVESFLVLIFFGKNFVYPYFIETRFFREKIGVTKWWGIRAVADWTMTYRAGLWTRNSCQYEGELHQQSGLPHGQGRWVDDSYWGESLSGMWEHGRPVAPYVARQYGTGDTFCAIPIAYFQASDDYDFDNSKLFPTNEDTPRCGVASVECSVSGAFFKHLPLASEFYGPFRLHETSLADCCRRLVHMHHEVGTSSPSEILVQSNDTGIHVQGHVYEPTGLPFAETNEVRIHVRPPAPRPPSSPNTRSFGVLPRDTSARHVYFRLNQDEPSDADVEVALQVHPEPCTLSVQDWIPTPHKAALIYFPGFNSPLKQSLETLGQFMALTRLSEFVYPIVFEWPCGKVPTYRYASCMAADPTNRERVVDLLKGLRDAGIRDVHLMSHSMGVQSLLGAFDDKPDGSRSNASKCFRLDARFADEDSPHSEVDVLLRCKSVTLLNPDFTVSAFVDHAFLGVRRICSHITVVGDQNDKALWWSTLINGVFKYFGHEQSDLLCPREADPSIFESKQTIGREFHLLYRQSSDPPTIEGSNHGPGIFARKAPVTFIPDELKVDHQWLDVDVIDTTMLDTNIANLRHSAFNVNPILLKDLEELIIAGARAEDRKSLVYREGNVYSYAHAPSFVVS